MRQLTLSDLVSVTVFFGVMNTVDVDMCGFYLISVLKGKKLSLPA